VRGSDLAADITKRNIFRVLLVVLLLLTLYHIYALHLDPNHYPWFAPQPLLQVTAIIIGIILLSGQLDGQLRRTLYANREQSQDKLKLDLYQKIGERLEATTAPLTTLMMTPTGIMGQISILGAHGIVPRRYSFSELQDLESRASEAVLNLTATLETYEIAMPGFVEHRRRIADAMRCARGSYGDFSMRAAPFVTAEPAAYVQPTADKLKELSLLADATAQAGVEVVAAIADLRIDAQNHLVGDLFRRRVPKREPLA